MLSRVINLTSRVFQTRSNTWTYSRARNKLFAWERIGEWEFLQSWRGQKRWITVNWSRDGPRPQLGCSTSVNRGEPAVCDRVCRQLTAGKAAWRINRCHAWQKQNLTSYLSLRCLHGQLIRCELIVFARLCSSFLAKPLLSASFLFPLAVRFARDLRRTRRT